MTYPCGRVPLSALPTRSRVWRAPMSCHSAGKEPAMGHAPGYLTRDAEGRLRFRPRRVKPSSADPEGGSSPADRQAASMTRLLTRRAESCQRRRRLQRLVTFADTPVRWLECASRTTRFPSADHEGGSGPAHHQVAFMTGTFAHRAKGYERCQQMKATCGLAARTRQMIGICGKPAQASQCRP